MTGKALAVARTIPTRCKKNIHPVSERTTMTLVTQAMVGCVLVFVVSATVNAQQRTTIQLPTFQNFGMTTTVAGARSWQRLCGGSQSLVPIIFKTGDATRTSASTKLLRWKLLRAEFT